MKNQILETLRQWTSGFSESQLSDMADIAIANGDDNKSLWSAIREVTLRDNPNALDLSKQFVGGVGLMVRREIVALPILSSTLGHPFCSGNQFSGKMRDLGSRVAISIIAFPT